MKNQDYPQWSELAWPASKLNDALDILARKSGLASSPVELPAEPAALSDPEYDAHGGDDIHGQWISFIADQFGIEAEAVESTYADLDDMLANAGPAILRIDLPEENAPLFLVLLKKSKRRLCVITPQHRIKRLSLEVLRQALVAHLETDISQHVRELLLSAGVEDEVLDRAQSAILREQLGGIPVGDCWILRHSPGGNFFTQMRQNKLPLRLLQFFIAHMAGLGLLFACWWIVGRGSLQGEFEHSLLVAWGLILFTIIPFELFEIWAQSLLSIGMGGLFRLRLIFGALQLNPETVRHQGAGQFLGRVMESEAFEHLILQGGFSAVVAIIEIFIAAGILSMGSGGMAHALVLVGWLCVIFIMCWRYYRHSRNWINTYRHMTNDLVERMVGHRTRLAQEKRALWHEEEDAALNRYLKLSESLDSVAVQMQAFSSRGWLILGISGIAFTFVFAPESKMDMAVSLAGVMLASHSLVSLVEGIISVIDVKIAWEQVAPLFQVTAPGKDRHALSFGLAMHHENVHDTASSPAQTERITQTDSPKKGDPILMSKDLVFRYRDFGQPILRDCSLKIYPGDKLLLEGPSGGGKSTLASLIAGLRKPQSGLHLLRGFDMETLGMDSWRSRVVTAPQFHENHVFTETFSFNLLMGRRWPPTDEDLREAEIICRELGLGEVLDRMPAGFQQMVGESGWQLSHGERSRLFIARALLQQSDIIVLDESFAALDPANLHKALECVFRRAPTLLVIAHP